MDKAQLFFKATARSFPGGAKKLKLMIILQGICTVVLLYFWIWFFGGLIPGFVWGYVDHVVEIHGGEQSVFHYFPDLKHDGYQLRWAHALNSRDKLNEALVGDAHLLEADVMLDGQFTRLQKLVPIMAHPPETTSELTFRKWLHIIRSSKKGIMLDFKTADCVELVLQDLRKVTFTRPVWLAADIAVGPGGLNYAVDSTRFLRLATNNYPRASLVLGWTTNPDPDGIGTTCKNSGYTWAQAMQMAKVVSARNVKQPIIFKFRAPCLRHSMLQARWLAESFNASVLVWAGMKDYVKTGDMLFLRSWLPRHHVLYDLPYWLKQEFLESVNHTAHPKKLIASELTELADQAEHVAGTVRNQHAWFVKGVPGHALPGNRSVGLLSADAMVVSHHSLTSLAANSSAQLTLHVTFTSKKSFLELQICLDQKHCRVEHAVAMIFSFVEDKHVTLSGQSLKASIVDKQSPVRLSEGNGGSRCYLLQLELSLETVAWKVYSRSGSSLHKNSLLGAASGHVLDSHQLDKRSLYVGLRAADVAIEQFTVEKKKISKLLR